jgi:hypothetical protein
MATLICEKTALAIKAHCENVCMLCPLGGLEKIVFRETLTRIDNNSSIVNTKLST